MEPTIRTAAPPDAAPLSALAVETYRHAFAHSFSAEDLRSHLDRKLSPLSFARILATDVVLVADMSGRLVGYAQFATAPAAPAAPPHPPLPPPPRYPAPTPSSAASMSIRTSNDAASAPL